MIVKPKGTYDLYGEEARKWNYVNGVIADLMEKYNYDYIRTPIFEASELFHRGVGETTDIVTKETYDFVDRGDRNMTFDQKERLELFVAILKIRCMVMVFNLLSYIIMERCIVMSAHKPDVIVNLRNLVLKS